MKSISKHYLTEFIRFIIVVIMVWSSIFLIKTCYSGYSLYKEVTEEVSIDEKITQIRSSENYVTIENIPKSFLEAIVSIEDHRFYKHSGLDAISIVRAAASNIKNFKIISGGSTITQQLAKNIYFSSKRKYTRKIAEAIVALKLEKRLSKEEILELYVNIIYFGSGNYGIKEAANGYFNVEVNDLTLEQSIIIAGLPQAPSIYTIDKDNERTRIRIRQVINAMVISKHLSNELAGKVLNRIDYNFGF